MSRDLVDTWYELMVAKLIFTKPLIKLFDMHVDMEVGGLKKGGGGG